MPFQCSICGEESTRICARCTKDACNNHICEKCLRCSDCCECEIALSEQPPSARSVLSKHETAPGADDLNGSETMARMRTGEQSPEDNPLSDIADVESVKGRPETGGQSGDTQGLSDLAEADSESVRELVEEGQYFEAAVISGIENAPDADVAEVTTTQVPEDDVPLEYLERDKD